MPASIPAYRDPYARALAERGGKGAGIHGLGPGKRKGKAKGARTKADRRAAKRRLRLGDDH